LSGMTSEDDCPKCHKPLMQTIVEKHPSRDDLAIHNFRCVRSRRI
jgi:hypothetical protein